MLNADHDQRHGLLSHADLAKTLGISRSSARSLLLDGRLPHLEIGNRRYSRAEWVVTWLSEPDNEPKPDTVDGDAMFQLEELLDRRAQGVRDGVKRVGDLPARSTPGQSTLDDGSQRMQSDQHKFTKKSGEDW